MSKKSKFMTGLAFPVHICDALRHHVGTQKSLESKRKIAFEDRDAAIAELEDLDDHKSPEALKVKERHSDAMLQIDSLDKQIKFHRNQVQELIEKPDEPKLDFEYEMPPDPVKPKQLKLGDGDKDSRPVGRRPKGPAGDAPVADGENQHLGASVTELEEHGLKGEVCRRLVRDGFATIGQLVEWMNDGANPAEFDSLHGSESDRVVMSLKAFLKKHNKAQVDKDLGRGDEPIRNQRGPRVGKGAPGGKKDTGKGQSAKGPKSGTCNKCGRKKGPWANDSKTLCDKCVNAKLDEAVA